MTNQQWMQRKMVDSKRLYSKHRKINPLLSGPYIIIYYIFIKAFRTKSLKLISSVKCQLCFPFLFLLLFRFAVIVIPIVHKFYWTSFYLYLSSSHTSYFSVSWVSTKWKINPENAFVLIILVYRWMCETHCNKVSFNVLPYHFNH